MNNSDGVLISPGFDRLLVASIACLSATITLKIASVQLLEIIELCLAFYVLARIALDSWRFTANRVLLQLVCGYAVFLVLASLGAMLALTRPFYLETQGLYQPGYITAARAAELIASVSAMILLINLFRRNRALCMYGLRAFFLVGTISALLSLIGVVLVLGLKLPFPFVADGRATGFLNEGGPYGLYMLGVFVSGAILRPFCTRPVRQILVLAQICNGLAFVASASKAGYIAAALLLVCYVFLGANSRKRAITGLAAVALLTALLFTTNALSGVEQYVAAGEAFETLSLIRPEDQNFVIGRVAGVFLVPRMIRAHPWTGVGWGNYGLVRNNVQYRGLAPVVGVTDSPGLGLYGLAAETGIPLVLLLCWLLLRPVRLVFRLTRWRPVITLALVQPVAHLCGAQLNMAYPWVVTAFAVGLAGMPVPANLHIAMQDRNRETFGGKDVPALTSGI